SPSTRCDSLRLVPAAAVLGPGGDNCQSTLHPSLRVGVDEMKDEGIAKAGGLQVGSEAELGSLAAFEFDLHLVVGNGQAAVIPLGCRLTRVIGRLGVGIIGEGELEP